MSVKCGLAQSDPIYSYANMYMRNKMIASSMRDGLDENGVRIRQSINDGSGLSSGMYGDGFHLAGTRLNFKDILEGNLSGGPLGGTQSRDGTLFGFSYSKGGFINMVLESYAGPHDAANSLYFYDAYGRGIDIPGLRGKLLEYSTNYTSSLAFATPFAAAAVAEQSNYSAYRYLRK